MRSDLFSHFVRKGVAGIGGKWYYIEVSASNHRIREYATYHHLMSRIAHRVYFMTDDVRNDFIEMIRRVADYSGIQLVAWCIMTNHFHLLAYLPIPEKLDEKEILRRYGVLKGKTRLVLLQDSLAAMRRMKDGGEESAQRELDRIYKTMYDIGWFMKTVKQWMTQEYNRRNAHVGTLWESVYVDVSVPPDSQHLGERAGYIHLNPIRAAIEYGFSEYRWSSLNALKCGDEVALKGMRRIYGEEATREEILEAHSSLMAKLLEKYKFEKAVEIVRKRNAGYEVPCDPLTDEALMVQAKAHLARVIEESEKDRAIRGACGKRAKEMSELVAKIKCLLAENPKMTGMELAAATGRPVSTVYRVLGRIKGESKFSQSEKRGLT